MNKKERYILFFSTAYKIKTGEELLWLEIRLRKRNLLLKFLFLLIISCLILPILENEYLKLCLFFISSIILAKIFYGYINTGIDTKLSAHLEEEAKNLDEEYSLISSEISPEAFAEKVLEIHTRSLMEQNEIKRNKIKSKYHIDTNQFS